MTGLRGIGLAVVVGLAFASTGRAADQDEIDKAVKGGVAYLKKQRFQGGHGGDGIGATALIGLTLLECGLTAGDDVVADALKAVREASPRLGHTYSIALSILLLDRNGDPGDVALIESLGVRLMAGQNNEGGWSYECPTIDEAEVRRLTAHVKQQNELRGSKEIPKFDPKDKEKPKDKPERKTEKDLPREIQHQLGQLRQVRMGRGTGGDNSNTQFATLGLWVARRHGLPVDGHLRLVDQRFRNSQSREGGWGYMALGRGIGGDTTAPMTCAGLLGLAVGYGVANDQKKVRDPAKDPALAAALVLLGTAIGQPIDKAKRPGLIPRADGKAYYFLWSLERVAVILDLKTIAKKDWYGWGTDVLVVNQQNDGSWQGEYSGSGADTCFALLFLRRANLARDLTANFNKFSDPGEITLKTGGVGGEALTGKKPDALKDPLAATTKKEKSSSPEPGPKPTPLSSKEADNPAVKLGTNLVKAEGKLKRQEYLKELRDTKGQDYTDALAEAIRQLEGDARTDAREALAERLTRMTAKTLRGYMEDTDPEIRRAAALASGMKDARENIPAMIELLNDRETLVVRATHAALKAMTNKDFGPARDAKPEDHAKAVAAWKAWWKEHGK